jgi:sulfatase maturation enzyme AslB (radical SAM superfamily)
VNKIPRPNLLRCTYCHQIGHQINECPFIEDNVKQRFVEHFQKLNLKVAKFKNHGYCEPHELYHEKVRIPDKLRE